MPGSRVCQQNIAIQRDDQCFTSTLCANRCLLLGVNFWTLYLFWYILLDLETGTEPAQVSQHLVQTFADWCGPEQLTGPEITRSCCHIHEAFGSVTLATTATFGLQAGLPGFYDPCVGEEKSLKLLYQFRGVMHQVISADTDPLRIPKQCECPAKII